MEIKILQYTKDYLDLLYLAGRGCYGLEFLTNETNLDKSEFIKNLVKNQHESVLEHGIITLMIIGCSRTFMSKITRHRLASFSVKSTQFTNYSNFKYKKIESKNSDVIKYYRNLMKIINETYLGFIQRFNIPIYIAREILPNACLTNITMTTNFREWRHIIKIRETSRETSEIRNFAIKIKGLFQTLFPEVFFDL